MDDPWGSPWATSDHPPSRNELAPPPSPPKALLSPPPRAFVGSASASPAQSPWLDDGGFGDWSGTDLNHKKSLTDWGVWGESTLQQPPSASRHNDSGRASPLAWPSSTATSPGLKPLPRSRTSSIYRQPSPDPWATEFSSKNRRETFSSFSLSVQEETGSKTEILPEEAIQSSYLDAENGRVGLGKDGVKPEEETGLGIDQDETEQPRVSPVITTSQGSAGPATKSVLNEIPETSPRPSSTFSHPSSQEIERQDSPITSIDEDSKARLQPTSRRKSSGKVQELVGRYDDLAKTTAAETLPIERRETPRRKNSTTGSPRPDQGVEEDDEAADFGDFEDVAKEGEASGSGSAPILPHPNQPSTPRGHTRNNTISQTSTPKSAVLQSPNAKATSAAVEQLFEKFGPIQFNLDLSTVDKLFPATDELQDGGEGAEHSEVPDRLITDSFASISERKAWYRISRYGSNRKHDLGDDENYHRVMWSSSEARTETLKIVRRWMEEDSYTGRAILGGSKRTSVFNWDSTAAPVDLNAVFGRKPQHSRSSSVQQQQQQQQQQQSQPRHSTTSSIHSVSQPPSAPVTAPRASTSSLTISEVPSTPVVAGFGWSSTVSESPRIDTATAAAPSGKSRQSIDPPPPPSRLSTSTPIAIARAKAPSSLQPPQPQPQLQTNKADEVSNDDNADDDDEDEDGDGGKDDDGEDDDEDDWGEMVSSPQVATHPSIEQVFSAPTKRSEPSQQQLDEEPQVASIAAEPPAAAAAAADPWAFVDLSVFDASAAVGSPPPPTMTAEQLKPSPMIMSSSTSDTEPPFSSKTLDTNVVPTSTSPSVRSSPPVRQIAEAPPTSTPKAVVLGPIEEGKQEQGQQQDEVVRRIVRNLPDLSYMLR